MPPQALLFAAAICLLAHTSYGSRLLQRRHYTEGPEINDDGDAQLVGQSRAWGGQEQVKEVDAFPWFNILFRNPQATLNDFARPLDGYTTGYAIEVAHNVILGHKEAIRRASHMHGGTQVMQGWQRLGLTRRWIDPYNDTVWEDPQRGGLYRGVVRLLADLGPHYALYRIRQEKYPFAERAARELAARPESRLDRDGLPPFDWPRGKWANAYEYPRLNKNIALKASICYMYAMAAPYDGGKYDERARRKFSRWPVKLAQCEQEDCLFVFDDTPVINPIEDIRLRGWQCDTWQDVGAPIMCSDKGFPAQTFTDYYQRRHLMLSYVVLPPRPHEPRRANCYGRVHAMRIADHVDQIERAIDKLRKSGGL